jgi:O-antigen/teichoic acid export membrane protein
LDDILETVPQRKITTFRGDVLRLASGTAIAQAISILAAPVVARLYAPEAFGVAATFISISALLGVIACMRYELSIVLPESDREAANLVAVSVLAAMSVAAVIAFVLWLGQESLVEILPVPAVAAFLWLIPVVVVIQGLHLALNYWNSRIKHFTRQSVAQVAGSVTTTSVQIGAGLSGYATGGSMIAANVGGQAAAVTLLLAKALKHDGAYLIRNIRWRDMLDGIGRHRKFPIYSTWSGLLNTSSWQLQVLLLGAFFSPAIVGFYALGFRLLQMPMNLIGGAVSQVFLQRAGEARNAGTLAPLVEALFERLVMVSMFPMLILSIVGEQIYVVVFGNNWAEAGIYTQILSVWAFVWFVSSPLARLFFVLGKQEFSLALNSMIFVTRLAALGAGGYFQSVYLALGLFALTGILLYGYQVLVVLRWSGTSIALAWGTIRHHFLVFAPFGVMLIGLRMVGANNLLLIAAAGLSMAIFGVLILKRELGGNADQSL